MKSRPTISVMLAVPDAPAAVEWYQRAVGAKARDPVRDHEMPWGKHRQGGFTDPFGHIWLVGDRSPLRQHDP
ncbi:MAG: hypothetical protein ABI408_10055 [Gemmatimonadaceae bacterium]